MSVEELAASLFYRALSCVLPARQRVRLANYIADRSSGDAGPDHRINGEERLVTKVKNRLAKRGAQPIVVFDVGANIGEWTANFVNGLNANATIYSFEPVKRIYDRMVERVKSAASSAKIVPINAALSDHTGKTSMFVITDEVSGLNTLVPRKDQQDASKFTKVDDISLIQGDAFCEEHHIEHIDFLKIDTEGHELAVIRGFDRMISQNRIDVIQFEYGQLWLDSRGQLLDAFEYFTPRGYVMAKINPEGLEVLPGYSRKMERFRLSNYVALLPELKGELA